MKKNEIKVGGHYRAKVSGNLVTVRVDAIKEGPRGISRNIYQSYEVTNLLTGRKMTLRSAAKFRSEVGIGKTIQVKGTPITQPIPIIDLEPDSTVIVAEKPSVTADRAVTKSRSIKEGEQRSGSTSIHRVNETIEKVFVGDKESNLRLGIDVPMPKFISLTAKIASIPLSQPDTAPHLIVEARAGTGKTTTLVEALKVLKGTPTPGFVPSPQQQAVFDAVSLSKGKARTICFCAFNKSIADELKDRVPLGVEAKTMHGMGYAAVRKVFGDVAMKEDRVKNIIYDELGIGPRPVEPDDATDEQKEETERLVKEWNEKRISKVVLVRAVEELVGLCKMDLPLLDYYNHKGELAGKGDTNVWVSQQLEELANRHEIDTNGSWEQVVDLVPRVLDRCRDVGKDNTIDYNDMIWLPVVLNLPVFKFDLLFGDEVQDWNRCQQELAKRAGRRLILCGDSRQAIYAFCGADSDSIPRMKRELSGHDAFISLAKNMPDELIPTFMKGAIDPPRCITLPLTVTRRCGKAIVKEANRIVKDFTAHESNGEGSVRSMKYPIQPGRTRGEKIVLEDKDTYLPHVKDGDMVICRSNAPLTKQCLKFLKLGRRARIQGRDIGDNLIGLVKKMKTESVNDLVAKLGDWLRNETAKEQAKASPDEGKLDRLNDRYESAMVFTDEAKTVEDVIRKIDSVFINDPTLATAPILLSSIHRCKGLESKRVFFLRPTVNPTRQRMPDWQRVEEDNLTYVGVTRAIEELIYVY